MNCNNECNNQNDGFEEARRIIAEAQRRRPTYGCCSFPAGNGTGATGPTGPTGPAGPTTIAVGTTTTGLPGADATVTNVGTAENLILDFVVPAGITGPEGATGPTGPAGLDAATPTLTIGTVTTGAPGTDATASITGTAPDFVLNLTIPAGPTGPTGP